MANPRDRRLSLASLSSCTEGSLKETTSTLEWTSSCGIEISEQVFRIQHYQNRQRQVVHFDRLKLIARAMHRLPVTVPERSHVPTQIHHLLQSQWCSSKTMISLQLLANTDSPPVTR